MIVKCDKCNTKLKVDDKLIKKPVIKIKCPKCSHVFEISKEPEDDVFVVSANNIIEDQCKVISICNQKGGVAKTSTCLNLGASLALDGFKVLLIDFDVLANLTISLGYDKAQSFYEVLKTPTTQLTDIIKKHSQNLWLLPSNSDMNLLPKRYLQSKNFEYLLDRQVKNIKQHYDYILIDTPPSMEFFTLNALITADLVIIPTQCEYFSMNGIGQVESIIDRLNTQYHKNKAFQILITMYDDKNMASKVILNKLATKYSDKILTTKISVDPKIPESQIMNVPVVHYAKKSIATVQYKQLAKEISQ